MGGGGLTVYKGVEYKNIIPQLTRYSCTLHPYPWRAKCEIPAGPTTKSRGKQKPAYDISELAKVKH